MKTKAADRRAYFQRWRRAHRKENAERMRRFRKEKPQQAKAIKERFAKAFPGYMKVYQKEWNRKNFAAYLLKATRGRAKQRGHRFTLTKEWVVRKLALGKCEQTNVPFSYDFKVKHPFRPTIDRINSKLGYTAKNCQMVCCIFNLAKSNWGNETVWQMIRTAKRKMRKL